jgi:hypothetical protein
MTFESKRDTWFTVLLGFSLVIVIVAFTPVVRYGGVRAIFPCLLMGGVLALMGSVYFGTRYRIEDDVLDIRCGLFHWRVPLRDIESVTPTDDPSSGPALSLDRLSIRYRKAEALDEILVSPRDKEAFLAALGRT